MGAGVHATLFTYDEREQLREVQQSELQAKPANDPNRIRTTPDYHYAGNLRRVTRRVGSSAERATDYIYDGLNRLRKETEYPSCPSTATSLVREYGYDANGNRTSVKKAKGQTTTYVYERQNRLTNMQYGDRMMPAVVLALSLWERAQTRWCPSWSGYAVTGSGRSTVVLARAASTTAAPLASSGTSGRRGAPTGKPTRSSAYLSGIGFVVTKQASVIGSSRR